MSDDDNTPARRSPSPPTPRATRHGPARLRWNIPGDSIPTVNYRCGYCDNQVASYHGLVTIHGDAGMYICPSCTLPTFISGMLQIQTPLAKEGNQVLHLPADVLAAYEEARTCLSIRAYTAAALIFRKILMHVAVSQGADEDKSFKFYVGYLETNQHITASMKGWVDEIREGGNQAAHEIPAITRQAAENLLTFTEMLLRIMYEFPGRLQGPTT